MPKIKLDLEQVNKIIESLNRFSIKPETVILHGSYAKGTYVEGVSDYDIIVVSRDFEGMRMEERLSLLADAFKGFKPRIEAIGYTKEEIKREMKRINPLVLDALEYGSPIYGKESFRELKEEFEKLKRKLNLKPIKGGWKYD